MPIVERSSTVPALVYATFVSVGVLAVVLFRFGHDPLSLGFPVLGYYPWAFAAGEPTYSPARMQVLAFVFMPLYVAVGVLAARKKSRWLAFVFFVIPVISATLFWVRFLGFMNHMS